MRHKETEGSDSQNKVQEPLPETSDSGHTNQSKTSPVSGLNLKKTKKGSSEEQRESFYAKEDEPHSQRSIGKKPNSHRSHSKQDSGSTTGKKDKTSKRKSTKRHQVPQTIHEEEEHDTIIEMPDEEKISKNLLEHIKNQGVNLAVNGLDVLKKIFDSGLRKKGVQISGSNTVITNTNEERDVEMGLNTGRPMADKDGLQSTATNLKNNKLQSIDFEIEKKRKKGSYTNIDHINFGIDRLNAKKDYILQKINELTKFKKILLIKEDDYLIILDDDKLKTFLNLRNDKISKKTNTQKIDSIKNAIKSKQSDIVSKNKFEQKIEPEQITKEHLDLITDKLEEEKKVIEDTIETKLLPALWEGIDKQRSARLKYIATAGCFVLAIMSGIFLPSIITNIPEGLVIAGRIAGVVGSIAGAYNFWSSGRQDKAKSDKNVDKYAQSIGYEDTQHMINASLGAKVEGIVKGILGTSVNFDQLSLNSLKDKFDNLKIKEIFSTSLVKNKELELIEKFSINDFLAIVKGKLEKYKAGANLNKNFLFTVIQELQNDKISKNKKDKNASESKNNSKSYHGLVLKGDNLINISPTGSNLISDEKIEEMLKTFNNKNNTNFIYHNMMGYNSMYRQIADRGDMHKSKTYFMANAMQVLGQQYNLGDGAETDFRKVVDKLKKDFGVGA